MLGLLYKNANLRKYGGKEMLFYRREIETVQVSGILNIIPLIVSGSGALHRQEVI